MPARVAALVAVAAAGLTLAAPAQAQLRFERCGAFGFQCARLSVPLDHSGVVPGRVSLYVKRVRARGRATRPPLVVLAGGPGQSATAAFNGDALAVVYPAYRNRDLIVFDQRGTGRSGALRCRLLEEANLLSAGVAAGRCAQRLGRRRAFYTSRDSVEDIELLRRALRAERVALFGTSYGTKVALGYALSHPDSIERLALDSVVEAGGPDPFYRDTFEAVPRALRAVCAGRCSAFTRDPVDDVARLVRRLAESPLRGRIVGPRGRRRAAELDRGDVFSVLLAGDFDPSLRAAFPGAVRSALAGDAAPMLRLLLRAYAVDGVAPRPRELSAMLYATTTCEETPFPWPRDTPPDPRMRRSAARAAVGLLPDSTFAPFDRGTALDSDLIDLCGRWPAAPAAPGFGSGPLPDVPVLLIEGEDDLRTPVENAQRVAAQFPRAQLVVAPATGHSALGSDGSGCTERAFGRFLQGSAVTTRCRRTRREFPVTPPAPTSLAAVPRSSAAAGRRGRVLNALALTLSDVFADAVAGFIFDIDDPDIARNGGLRAGRYRVDGRGTLHLTSLEYVRGVAVSGTVTRFGQPRQRGRLRIEGRPGVPSGRLTLRGLRVRGRLGGRLVQGPLRPSAESGGVRAAAAATQAPIGR